MPEFFLNKWLHSNSFTQDAMILGSYLDNYPAKSDLIGLIETTSTFTIRFGQFFENKVEAFKKSKGLQLGSLL